MELNNKILQFLEGVGVLEGIPPMRGIEGEGGMDIFIFSGTALCK